MRRVTPVLALLGLSLGIGLAPAASAQDAPSFSNDIWPIFVQSCIECHGPDKQKESLRFDDLEWAGDDELVVAGDPEESLVFQLISKPHDDEEIMPNEGDPLTKEEIDLIAAWIKDGASYGDWDPIAAVAALPTKKKISAQDRLLNELAAKVSAPADADLAALREVGALALPLAMENPLVRVDFQLSETPLDNEVLSKLMAVSEQVTWLGLAGTAVTDEQLAHVGKLKNLTALHLENTSVSDAGLKHLSGLENLSYLNLYGTQVSDDGLAQLEGLKGLRKLYLWQSNATKEGADTLAAAIPGLEVNIGVELAAAEVMEKKDLSGLFDEGSCCAKAHEDGKACDHDCCIAAAAKNEVCTKCNPGASEKLLGGLAKVVPEEGHLRFNRDIRPILAENCFQCHGPDANVRKADLRLDVREVAIAKAIVPGDVTASELVRRISSVDANEHMPPHDSTRSLSKEQVAVLTQWVEEGARYEAHWALLTPERPALNGDGHPVDQFVADELKRHGLGLSPPGDPVTLVRRLSFDLIGLPPKAHQVEAFSSNPTDEEFARLVDDLLASPGYGERMATDWLDLVRYADTNGYHSDEPRSVWPYRDYVINAFNANKPFDEFTIEQLAGDLIPERTTEQLIASGYNRMNQITAEGGAQAKEYRAIYASDRVRTTSSVWLGATLGCAQCHDHKFDPYTMKDFYSFAAFFDDINEKAVYGSGQNWAPFLELPTVEQAAERTELERVVAPLRTEFNLLTEELLFDQWAWEVEARDSEDESLPKKVVRALKVEQGKRSKAQKETLLNHYRTISPLLKDTREELHETEELLANLINEIPTTLISESIEPRETRILPRGNWLDDSGPVVQPATPEALTASEVEGRRATRLDLAEWMVSDENPLTARVFVNRLWRNFFGVGLSNVVDDLGSQGEWPTHPELLDWLAVEFVESGWDIKHLVRLIVTSETYRQSSVGDAKVLEVDPYNRLLARQSSMRLAAETVRDNVLAISGLLNTTVGGRSVYPYQPEGYYDDCNQFGAGPALYPIESDANQYRRGMYTFWKRSFLHPSMMAFDAPSREECVAQRTSSNTPQQALVLLNDPTYIEAARAFAERIIREGGTRTSDRLAFAYREALSRVPHAEETELLRGLYQRHLMDYTKNPEEARKALQNGQHPIPEDIDSVELASWTSIARVILNLHETITRA